MGEHTKLGMWGGNWNFQAAENIDGQNAVIWKEQYSDGYFYLWLTLHDENWAYTDSGDAGYWGDPRYGDLPDDRFYLTETSFNIDLNQDGRVGGPPNQDPLLTGQKATLADGTQNNNYTIDYWDLIQGFTDPEGDYLSIEEGSLQVNNGSIYFDQYFQHYVFTPDTDFSGQVDISYNVIDENGGSVNATQSFNICLLYTSDAADE